MAEPLIEISQLQKTFPNGLKLFSNLNLSIYPGEFISILGSSGSGKSTLLKLILELEFPTQGNIKRSPDLQSKTGVVFQEPRLLPWMTVGQNVGLPLRIQGIEADPKTLSQAFRLARLSVENEKLYPDQLSGGMKMRAALARAFINSPELLVMDEPFSALDEPTRFLLQQELRSAFEQNEQQSILFVTHSISEAVFLSDRILILGSNGSLVSEHQIEHQSPRSLDFRFSASANSWMKRIFEELQLNRIRPN